MSFRNESNSAAQPPSQVDEAAWIDLWDVWRLAELEAGFALDAWYEASKGDKARAFAVYTAALEREAQAADALAEPAWLDSGVDEALAA